MPLFHQSCDVKLFRSCFQEHVLRQPGYNGNLHSRHFHTTARQFFDMQLWELRVNMAETLCRKGKLDEANLQVDLANTLYAFLEQEHCNHPMRAQYGDPPLNKSCGLISQCDEKMRMITPKQGPGDCDVARWLEARSLMRSFEQENIEQVDNVRVCFLGVDYQFQVIFTVPRSEMFDFSF